MITVHDFTYSKYLENFEKDILDMAFPSTDDTANRNRAQALAYELSMLPSGEAYFQKAVKICQKNGYQEELIAFSLLEPQTVVGPVKLPFPRVSLEIGALGNCFLNTQPLGVDPSAIFEGCSQKTNVFSSACLLKKYILANPNGEKAVPMMEDLLKNLDRTSDAAAYLADMFDVVLNKIDSSDKCVPASMNSENFQAEIFGITEAVGLAFEGLDFVVDAFEGTGRGDLESFDKIL